MKFVNNYFLQAFKYSGVRYILPVLLAGYFLFNFLRIATSGQGMLGFGVSDFGMIFPFYLLLLPFVGTLSLAVYLVLYAISSAFYVGLVYSISKWLDRLHKRMAQRPKFKLKHI